VNLGLDGRVALVTAASRGLGLAAATALAEEGCDLVICARSPGPLAEAAVALRGRGVDVLAVEADVIAPDTADRLVGAALERFGRLDVLVANGGGPPKGGPLEVTDDDLEAALQACLLSLVRLARAAVPPMQAGGWGRICLIASNGVQQPHPDFTLSATARTGLWGWAKAASHRLAGDGITVNMACPGFHRTERLVELAHSGAAGDAADFGRVVAFLCSEPAGWVNGVALKVDGGDSHSLL
jgi:3-oxoacyl-[acyl-carrier protein] reductase